MRLTSPPVEGAANKLCREFIANQARAAKGQVTLITATNRAISGCLPGRTPGKCSPRFRALLTCGFIIPFVFFLLPQLTFTRSTLPSHFSGCKI
ncbi:MAG: DUF167 domain-containing protein [Syntrophotaleaceae bacterium]